MIFIVKEKLLPVLGDQCDILGGGLHSQLHPSQTEKLMHMLK